MQLTRRPAGRPGHAVGYTTLELLVAMGVGLLALGTASAFHRFQLMSMRDQATQLDVQVTTRSFFDLFAREVRRAGRDPGCVKTFSALPEAGQWRLRVQADIDGDGTVTGVNEDVVYAYNFISNRIERTANGTTATLVDNVDVTGSGMRYFDAAGAEIAPGGSLNTLTSAQREQVRRVRLELAFAKHAVNPRNNQPVRSRLATDVDLRNRFFVAGTACP